MKPASLSRAKWLGVLTVVLWGLVLLASCASEVGDIDRTKPDKLLKSSLKGVWYFAATVVEAPVPSPVTFDGEMAYFPGPTKVLFDIQEDLLVVYPTAELYVKGAEEKWHKKQIRNYWDEGKWDEFVEVYVGQPVAAYPIDSHFDVFRQYNAQTGEQSNVIIEDSSDRKWYERDYIRVDWSKNSVKDLLFMAGVSASPVDYYVQEFEEDNPDRFEVTDTSINFVSKMFLEPTSPDSCSIYLVAPADCVGVVAKVRYSFMKADPNDDYVPLFYPPENLQSRFAFFLTERYGYDEQQGLVVSAKEYLINRWDIWKDSRIVHDLKDPATDALVECNAAAECAGLHDGKVHCWRDDWFQKGHCVTWDIKAPHERGLRPIKYWLSSAWQKELLPSAYETADQWSTAFKETVAWTNFYSEKGMYAVEYCETNADCSGDSILDASYIDTYAKYCDPTAPPTDDTCRMDYNQVKFDNGYCTKEGTCRSPVGCGAKNPCSMGQLCYNHICHECKNEGGKCNADDPANGWEKIDVPVEARGAFSLYYVEETEGSGNDAKQVRKFRRGVDSAYPGLGGGQVWVSFAQLDPYVGKVKLLNNGVTVCTTAGGAEAQYVFQGAELFRTPGCVVELEQNEDTGQYIPQYANFSAIEVDSKGGAGKLLGQFNHVLLESQKVHTLALVGTVTRSELIHGVADPYEIGLGGMRFVHGVLGVGAYDFSIMGALNGKDVTFGTFTPYAYLTQKENRVVVLPAGSPGEITCYHDHGIGMCTGWRPELSEADMKRVQEIYESLPEMFVVCENIYTGDSCTEEERGDLLLKNDCRYWHEDKKSGEWSNPCSEVEGAMDLKKHGDLRYSMMYWVTEDQTASPLGYGPNAADPDTGEVYYGIANVYGAPMISYGQYAKDLLDAARGDLSKEDIISSKYIQEYIEKQEREGLYDSLYAPLPDPARMERIAKVRPEVKRFWLTPEEKAEMEKAKSDPSLKELLDPRTMFKRIPGLLSPSMSEAQIEARRAKIKGTWVEDLLINEEVKNIARDGNMLAEPLNSDDWEALSPLSWMSKSFLRNQRDRLTKLASHNYFAQDLAEPNVKHTAMKVAQDCKTEAFLSLYGGNSDDCEVWEITRRMLDGTLEHEVGHTVGLRHNFSASADAFNYQDEYFGIRERDVRWCKMSGTEGCVFGDYCNMDCTKDSDCLPEITGTSCREVQSEGELKKACVDAHLDPKGWCEGQRKSFLDCAKDEDCASLGKSKCNKRGDELLGRCEVPAKPTNGVCSPGSVAAGNLCLTDDWCKAASGKSVGTCGLDGSKTCSVPKKTQEDPNPVDECQIVWEEYYTVKTWCQEAGGWCDGSALPAGTTLCEGDEKDPADCEKLRYPVVSWNPRMKMTKSEEDKGRTEYQYSSLMDYGGTINFDIHGLGKYDTAAIRHGYGELTDVFTDVDKIYDEMEDVADYFGDKYGWSGLFMSTDIYGDFWWFSPFLFIEDFIGATENLDRIPVPTRKMDNEIRMLESNDRGMYDVSYRRVPYKCDPDGWRGALGAYYFDIGADQGEILEHSWNKLHEYYVFDAFKRERWGAFLGGSPLGYYARILDRWFPPMADAGRFQALFQQIFRPYGSWLDGILANQNWLGRWEEWGQTTFQRLSSLVFSPAPGSYMLVDEGTVDERYVNVSYSKGVPGSDVSVDIGDGKYPYTTFYGEAGYYYFEHAAFVGSLWEKLAALDTLTYAMGYFLGDYMGEQVPIGVGSSIGFNDLYYTEMTNALAGFIIGDRTRYAPYAEGGKMYPFDPLHPWEADGMPRLAPTWENLSFQTSVAWQAYSSVVSNFNPGFLDSMFLCLKGSGLCYDVAQEGDFDDANPWAVDVIEYTDPWSFKTYVAKTTNYDPNRINATYDLLAQANDLKEQYEAFEWGESPESDALKTELTEKLGKIRNALDMILALNYYLGSVGY